MRLGPNPPESGGDTTALGLQTGGMFRRPADALTRTVSVPIVGGAAPETLIAVMSRTEAAGTGGVDLVPIGLVQTDLREIATNTNRQNRRSVQNKMTATCSTNVRYNLLR
jgi:hypothetical protein